MSGHIRALTNEVAKDMKERIWEGDTATEVSKMFGLSALTVSRIRSGLAYEDVLWPDGTTGELPVYRVQALAGMRRRNTVSDKKFNAEMEDLYEGDEGFDWYKFYCAGIGIPCNEFNKKKLDEKARKAGFADLAAMGRARAPRMMKVWSDERDREAAKKHEKMLREYDEKEKSFKPEPYTVQRQDIIDPTNAPKRDWEEIIAMKPDLLEVLVVEADPDSNEALKLATQIALRPPLDMHDPVIRLKHWDDQETHLLIDGIKLKILAWQGELNALLVQANGV